MISSLDITFKLGSKIVCTFSYQLGTWYLSPSDYKDRNVIENVIISTQIPKDCIVYTFNFLTFVLHRIVTIIRGPSICGSFVLSHDKERRRVNSTFYRSIWLSQDISYTYLKSLMPDILPHSLGDIKDIKVTLIWILNHKT